jgi:hypothetical protein
MPNCLVWELAGWQRICTAAQLARQIPLVVAEKSEGWMNHVESGFSCWHRAIHDPNIHSLRKI